MRRWPKVNPAHLSIVVPTKNEYQNLPVFLASIPPQPEVVICDASADGTAALALQLRPWNTRVIAAPTTLAAARQRGAEAAAGSLLLFADADIAFTDGFFYRLCAGATWDAICGPKFSLDRYAGYYRLVAAAQAFLDWSTGVGVRSGSNMAIRRSVFFEVGGFRQELTCNEDSELFFRAARAGYEVRFDAGLEVTAIDHRRLERGVLRKSLHSLVRNALLYVLCSGSNLPGLLRSDWGYWSRPAGWRAP